MPNIASVMKEEIARVARKEIRAATDSLLKSSSRYRSDIAALKRAVADLEREVQRLQKAGKKTSISTPATQDAGTEIARFSAKGLASQRKRLGLSAAQMGLLLGVTGQSVYKWEEGSARPRKSHFAAIAMVRDMGRRDAAAMLESLGGNTAASK